MNTKLMSKGWMIVEGDTHLGKWVEEGDALQHDLFLPPLVCCHLEKGNCIIDCGANIGTHSVAYSRAVGVKGMVIAVEAGKLAHECLVHNITQFPYPNCYALHGAVSDVCGQSVTHDLKENVGASQCHEVKDEDRKVGEKYLLTVNIDYLAHQAERKIDWIKLDIEGFEAKALLGAMVTLKQDRPGLLIEVNSSALMLQGDTPEDIFSILDYQGYEWKICQSECKLGDPQFDILCLPREPRTTIS